ncbi:hypothetical protein EJ08DRAFT_133404 [Tothia fuscella]|uniref:Uncharacterized protein n=1 Tax=Tothia fuscella TaxID=1048955 RepID=A0A9P4U075_9PEZI|nr:hypothetical protein EJ08DRAFT_133404 [Tothia fuscella]
MPYLQELNLTHLSLTGGAIIFPNHSLYFPKHQYPLKKIHLEINIDLKNSGHTLIMRAGTANLRAGLQNFHSHIVTTIHFNFKSTFGTETASPIVFHAIMDSSSHIRSSGFTPTPDIIQSLKTSPNHDISALLNDISFPGFDDVDPWSEKLPEYEKLCGFIGIDLVREPL